MLSGKQEDTTVQIPMESSEPIRNPKAHDPKWEHKYTRLNTHEMAQSANIMGGNVWLSYLCTRVSVLFLRLCLVVCFPVHPSVSTNYLATSPTRQFTISICFPTLHYPPFPLPRCDPSEINISDEMSKTTVWKSLSSNQKDTRSVAAKKARPYPLSLSSPPALNAVWKHCLPDVYESCKSSRSLVI